MNIAHPPLIIRKAFPKLVWNVSGMQDQLFLTFDDGPTPGVTEEVLTILEAFSARATFFCLGKNVDKYPGIYEKILSGGHSVGNHTYSHLNGWKTKTREYVEDVQLADKTMHASLFRPPYGKIKPRQSQQLRQQYDIVFWDVLSRDYDASLSPESCLDNVLTHSGRGSIIVFHDSVKAADRVLYALPRVLENFKDRHFHFRNLEEGL